MNYITSLKWAPELKQHYILNFRTLGENERGRESQREEEEYDDVEKRNKIQSSSTLQMFASVFLFKAEATERER